MHVPPSAAQCVLHEELERQHQLDYPDDLEPEHAPGAAEHALDATCAKRAVVLSKPKRHDQLAVYMYPIRAQPERAHAHSVGYDVQLVFGERVSDEDVWPIDEGRGVELLPCWNTVSMVVDVEVYAVELDEEIL